MIFASLFTLTSRSRAVRHGSLALGIVGLLASCFQGDQKTALASNSTVAQLEQGIVSFQKHDGGIENYFYRNNEVAAHVLLSKGADANEQTAEHTQIAAHARVVVAFPAGNTGVGLFFDNPVSGLQLKNQGQEKFLTPINALPMHGIEGLVEITTTESALVIRTGNALLGAVRTIREFIGTSDSRKQTDIAKEAKSEVIVINGGVRFAHKGADEKNILVELLPRDSTTIMVKEGAVTLQGKNCNGKLSFLLRASTDQAPLTPINNLLNESVTNPDGDLLQTLAFLSYKEKLLAGSWRFLTYFGRDTLLSVRMLMPVLKSEVIEAALGSVLWRMREGKVAHEETVGEFAKLLKDRGEEKLDEEGASYDYKMVDDDFLLAPVLECYLDCTGINKSSKEELKTFFSTISQVSHLEYRELLQTNLTFVLESAERFRKGADGKPDPKTLIAFQSDSDIGDWRDSENGIGRGRYSFNVNVSLVPAALEAAKKIYTKHKALIGDPPLGFLQRLDTAIDVWKNVKDLFQVSIPASQAASNQEAYRKSQGDLPNAERVDPALRIESLVQEQEVKFPAIALNETGKPIPILHTDEGFELLFNMPTPGEVIDTMTRILAPFPIGLSIKGVGLVIANPAYANNIPLPDLKNQKRRTDSVLDVNKRNLHQVFTNKDYHGTVVWSWQQALVASGLRRQIESFSTGDNQTASNKQIAKLEEQERTLWTIIESYKEGLASELWSFEVKNKKYVPVAFGQGGDAESNAAQLWSSVYLAVKRP